MPVVNIQMFEGRDGAKKQIAKEVTESLAKHAEIDPKYVYVIFEDVKPANWGMAGELFGEPGNK